MKNRNKKTTARRSSTVAEVAQAIRSHKSFLLGTHIRPEGDAVGSLLAIKELLLKLRKKVLIVNQDEFPERLDVMPADGWKTVDRVRKMKRIPDFDACIVVDCPNPARMGKVQSLIGRDTFVINIDHHVSNQQFGDLNLVNDRASACGEIVYDLFKELNVPLTKEAALPMYVSISTDTGSFKFGSTTAKTHLVASDLIKTGINLEHINENLYDRSSQRRLLLLSYLLDHMHVEMKGQVVWALISRRILDRTKATFEDTEGFIDFLRSMEGVRMAFILIEITPNRYQVSFRAKGANDVNQIAEAFGGGGHRKAAGCSLEGDPEKNAKKILAVIKRYFRKPTFSKSYAECHS